MNCLTLLRIDGGGLPHFVKSQGHTRCQFQIIKLEPSSNPYKIKSLLSNPYKISSNHYKFEIMITFLVEMLHLPYFGHLFTSAI